MSHSILIIREGTPSATWDRVLGRQGGRHYMQDFHLAKCGHGGLGDMASPVNLNQLKPIKGHSD